MLTLGIFIMIMSTTPPIKNIGLKARFLTPVVTINCKRFLKKGKKRGAGGK